MRFSQHIDRQLATQIQKTYAQQEAKALEELLAAQVAAKTALAERGLRLGKRLTRIWNLAGTTSKDYGEIFRLSKIAADISGGEVPDRRVQCRVAYQPPLRSDYKKIGEAETKIALRLQDSRSGAVSNFYDHVRFRGHSGIDFLPTLELPGPLLPITADSPHIPTIDQLLTTLEHTEFRLPD